MEPRTVKDPSELLRTLNDLKPVAGKLFLYLALSYRPAEDFRLTYWDISQKAHIKNPYLAINQLIEKKLLCKTNGSFRILVDLIE